MAIRRARHLAWRRIGDETVVIDLRGRRMHGLNRVAGLVWDLLDLARDVSELITELAAAQAGLDGRGGVRRFLVRLAEEGLVVETADEAQPVAPAADVASGVPELVWSEELARVVGQCGLQPAQCIPGHGGGMPQWS